MSINLIIEVLDHAPATLTYRELFLLIVFAEQARDVTRECWPGVEDDPRFLRRARLSRSQRYAAINSLISKGVLERVTGGRKYRRAAFRIQEMAPPDASTSAAEHAGDVDQVERPGIGVGQAPAGRRRDVQALLRQAGAALTDQAADPPHAQRPENRDAEPDPAAAAAEQRPANRDPEPPPQRPDSRASASRNASLSVPAGGTPIPQPRQLSSSRRRPADIVRNELGVDAGEAEAIAAAIEQAVKPHNLAGYITTLARNGDLADWQGHVREQAARRHAGQAADNRRTAPPCPHGEPGGDQINPSSGQPWCALCRNGVPPDDLDLAAIAARAS